MFVMKIGRPTVFFLATLTMLSSSNAVFAAEKQNQASELGQRLNRSVLTVGRDVFTALDAAALLLAWNATSTAPVEIKSQWLEGFELPQETSIDLDRSFKLWPQDVRTFFSIALIWFDVQKLNLFIPKEIEIDAGISKFEDKLSVKQTYIPFTLVQQMRGADTAQKKRWVEMVLRAQSFLRIRGSVERNKNIVDVGWYWHAEAERKKSK